MDSTIFKSAAESFASVMKAQVDTFRDRITGRDNPAVVGSYIEALVRRYINSWIAPKQIYHGSIWDPNVPDWKIHQIDGLVWEPSHGPAIINEGEFLILHPQVARAIVEIKTSVNSLKGLHDRLVTIWESSFRHRMERDVMAVVISHPDPEKASRPKWNTAEGHEVELHSRAIHNYPIFILFDSTDDDYRPFAPGIEAMITQLWYIGAGGQ